MMKEMIITELQNRGYRVELHTIVKNGVEMEGICFLTDSNVRPIIYIKEIIKMAEEENKTFDEIVTEIIDLYEKQKTVQIDLNRIFKKEFILKNIYIGLQKESTEDIIKRPCGFDGIESYLYITWKSEDGRMETKITGKILERGNISETEAWETAEANTKADTKIFGLPELIIDMLGLGCKEEVEQINEEQFLFVITNRSRRKGASAILNKEALTEFGKKYLCDKIGVLPSSIHEMIIFPATDETDLEALSDMVHIVNCTEVAPEERLTDRAYIIAL